MSYVDFRFLEELIAVAKYKGLEELTAYAQIKATDIDTLEKYNRKMKRSFL